MASVQVTTVTRRGSSPAPYPPLPRRTPQQLRAGRAGRRTEGVDAVHPAARVVDHDVLAGHLGAVLGPGPERAHALQALVLADLQVALDLGVAHHVELDHLGADLAVDHVVPAEPADQPEEQ